MIYISLIIFTCISVAYIINTIGGILNDMNKDRNEYSRDLFTINKYMKKKNIPINL